MVPGRNHENTKPNNHSPVATPMPISPPRRRMERRVAATPPGSSGRESRVEDSLMPTSQLYVGRNSQNVHRLSPSVRWLLFAALLWAGIWIGEWFPRFALVRWWVMPLLSICVLLLRIRMMTVRAVLALLFIAGLASGAFVWHQPLRILEGDCRGVATLRADPTFRSNGTATVLELQHKRYKVLAYGSAGRLLAQRLVGESVRVVGECSVNDGAYSRFDRINHVVGRMNVSSVSETFSEGSMFVRAANRMISDW